VLDASALMALLRPAPGNDKVQSALAEAAISAANFSEVLAKAAEIPKGVEAAKALLRGLQLPIVAFDEQQAESLRACARSHAHQGYHSVIAVAWPLPLPEHYLS